MPDRPGMARSSTTRSGRLRSGDDERVVPVGGLEHLGDALAPEQPPQHEPLVRIVVDDEHPGRIGHRRSCSPRRPGG